MVRHALVLAFASLSLAGRDSGCGSVDSSAGSLNAPCTRSSDCASGLTCQSGLCAGPNEDAGGPPSDAGIKDAATDG